MPTNDDRQRTIKEEAEAPGKPRDTKRRRLDIAVIVMLSVVTLMVIALLLSLLTTPGLLRR